MVEGCLKPVAFWNGSLPPWSSTSKGRATNFLFLTHGVSLHKGTLTQCCSHVRVVQSSLLVKPGVGSQVRNRNCRKAPWRNARSASCRPGCAATQHCRKNSCIWEIICSMFQTFLLYCWKRAGGLFHAYWIDRVSGGWPVQVRTFTTGGSLDEMDSTGADRQGNCKNCRLLTFCEESVIEGNSTSDATKVKISTTNDWFLSKTSFVFWEGWGNFVKFLFPCYVASNFQRKCEGNDFAQLSLDTSVRTLSENNSLGLVVSKLARW